MPSTEEFARQFGGAVEPESGPRDLDALAPASGEGDTAAFAQRFGGALEPSVGEQIVGGAEALARGASLGLSDVASDAIQGVIREGPYDQARDQARQERERRESQLGGVGTALEVGGAVAPALLSGGASAVGSAARMAPSALAAAAGEAVAGQMLAKFGTGVAAGIAKTALGTGIGGAIASGVQALSDRWPEFVASPTETAEHVLWEAGKGALLGAGIGGALGTIGAGVSRALKLGGEAAGEAAEVAGRVAPRVAERRAVSAVARGGRLGNELEAVGGPQYVGRVLLDEGVPLAGGADEVLGSLQGKVHAASKAVIEIQDDVARGAAPVEALAAATRREQALVYARDLADEAVRDAPARAGRAAGDAITGAIGGALLGGAPGAMVGGAVARAARGVAGERAAGLQALAFDQLGQLAERRMGLIAASARVGDAVEAIAYGAGRVGSQGGVAALAKRDQGPDLDTQIAQAVALNDRESPASKRLENEGQQLELIQPGLGEQYMAGALRRAELMSENVPPPAQSLYAKPPEVDPLTRLRLARRAVALGNPEAALARIARGQDAGQDALVMQRVYPQIWARFTTSLAQRVASKKPSYQDAVQLGVRTGIETVSALKPATLLSAQGTATAGGAQQVEQQQPQQQSAFKGKFGWNALERWGDKADRLAARGSQ